MLVYVPGVAHTYQVSSKSPKKAKMKCSNELQIHTWPRLSRGLVRGRADMLMLLFSPYLATSLAVDNGAANSQISSLLPNTHLSRHRSTAELRVVGIETRD